MLHQPEDSASTSAHGTSSCRDSCTSQDSPLLSSCCDLEDWTNENDLGIPLKKLPIMTAEDGRALGDIVTDMHEQKREHHADSNPTLNDSADDGSAILANMERSVRRDSQRVSNVAQVRLAPAEEVLFDALHPYSQHECSTDDLSWLVPVAHLQHAHAYGLYGL